MATVGPAKAITANDMLPSCEVFLREMKVQNDGQLSFPREGQRCWYYIMSIQELSTLADDVDHRPIVGALKICAPENSTLTQFLRIFVNYAQSNPDKLHLKASFVAVQALRKAFPCP
jgi:Rap1a immunity proteins